MLVYHVGLPHGTPIAPNIFSITWHVNIKNLILKPRILKSYLHITPINFDGISI